MCGIAGGWWPINNKSKIDFSAALQALQFRGPDGSGMEIFNFENGTLGLAQTRLAILDLTTAGRQPMFSSDGRWVIVFNGEIYNYKELRAELTQIGHIFHTRSDTEVLLAAWCEWRLDCLVKLVGMFAFAVFDRQLKRMVCVRDPFGIKPFYYHSNSSGFRFASEVPALISLLDKRPEVNWQRSYDYLIHGDLDSNQQTFYSEVHQLLPGHYIEIDLIKSEAEKPKRWWTPTITENNDWKFDEAVDCVRNQLLNNIRLHLRSDVPIGAALSGGVDSSILVCAMRHIEKDMPIHTFSFIATDKNLSEEKWVDRINSHVNAHAHKISIDPSELINDLDDLIRCQGEPFGSSNIYAQYRVYRAANENGIKVTLDGQGADEVMGGYNGYPGQRIKSLIDRGELLDACRFINAWSEWPGRSKTSALKSLIPHISPECIIPFFNRLNGKQLCPDWIIKSRLEKHGVLIRYPQKNPHISLKGRRLMTELAASLTERNLNALLRVGDRNSMRFSVESRVPFLTIELVNLVLSMPEQYLVSKRGETKHILREAMRGIVPDDVLRRRDKIGFTTPEKAWLTSIQPYINNQLNHIGHIPFIDKHKLQIELEKISTGNKPFSEQIWRWINFSRWIQICT